jgi:hypothetical protein
MKNTLVLTVIGLLSLSAQAGSTVCAGPNLYYSSVHADYGTKPPTGAFLGSFNLVFKGQILVSEKYLVGENKQSDNTYSVEFSEGEVVATDGNIKLGSQISKKTATIYSYKVTPDVPSELEVVGTEEVTCTKSWKMMM